MIISKRKQTNRNNRYSEPLLGATKQEPMANYQQKKTKQMHIRRLALYEVCLEHLHGMKQQKIWFPAGQSQSLKGKVPATFGSL